MNGHNIYAVRFEDNYEAKPKRPDDNKAPKPAPQFVLGPEGSTVRSEVEDLREEVANLRRMVNQLYYPFTPFKD